MLIVGAKGFAKEVLEVFKQLSLEEDLAFYDDINLEDQELLFDRFPVLRSEEQVLHHFARTTADFNIGIGNPFSRYFLYRKFQLLGGNFVSAISPFTRIGSYGVRIGKGSNILSNASISNTASLGIGCIVYYNVVVTHDCSIGNFVELSPGATILGRCKVGNFTHIGANATILPDIEVGENVIVGAGATVTRNIPDNSVAYGCPARIIKERAPGNFPQNFKEERV